MTIVTVTFNPAIDQTVRADGFAPNRVNRGQAMQWDAGGKGVNVASMLADYGCAVTATGFLGAANPEIFETLFAAKGIEDRFVRIPGRTRTGVKIVDEAAQQTTDINLPGATPPAEAIERLVKTIGTLPATTRWVVLAGNLPPGVAPSLLPTLIEPLRERGVGVALDTSGAALHAGVQAGPTLVKPNVEELEELVGARLASEAEIWRAAQALLARGIRLVIVSMGERGALFVTREQGVVARPPTVAVKTTVGAGDALVAGTVAAQDQGLDLTDTARLATAFAAAKLTRVGPHLPPRDAIQAYFSQVSVAMLDERGD